MAAKVSPVIARRAVLQPVLDDVSNPGHRKARDWYNGHRKKQGWPELPPLRAPIISLIDAGTGTVKWVPWSPRALEVPFKAGFDPSDDRTTKAIGNGEQRLLAHLGPGAVKSKDTEHDIDVGDCQILITENVLNLDPGPYEVKEISATRSAFAGAKGNRLAAELRFDYSCMIREIRSFISYISTMKGEERQLAEVPDVDWLRKFVAGTGTSVFDGGHISARSASGMSEAARRINAVLSASIGAEAEMMAHVMFGQHPIVRDYLADPTKAAAAYAKVGKPSDIFGSLKGVFIVHPEKFAVIPTSEVDTYICFDNISKGHIKISLTRAANSQ